MKRFLLVSLAFLGVLLTTAFAVSAQFGSEAALTVGLLALSAPLAFNPPSHLLGAATTVARDTQLREASFASIPLAASTLIPLGAMVALDANGNAVNAADTAGLRVVGRAEETVDNSAGSAGDLRIQVRRGCFLWDNSGTQAVTQAYVGKRVFVEDNQTVAITTTNKVVAGRVIEVATNGVWVLSTDKPLNAAVTDTSTNGAAASAADLAALKTEVEALGDTVRDMIAKIS